MSFAKQKIYAALEEIKKIIDNNENPDGTYKFDELRALVALETVKIEITKSLQEKT